MWFNRKSTDFQQAFAQVEKRLNAVERELQAAKSDNDRQLLEFAELAEKMRRTYLRLSRIVKVDSEPSSSDSEIAQNEQDPLSPRETRDAIEMSVFKQ